MAAAIQQLRHRKKPAKEKSLKETVQAALAQIGKNTMAQILRH